MVIRPVDSKIFLDASKLPKGADAINREGLLLCNFFQPQKNHLDLIYYW